ncbi:MAG: sodium:proton antiporter [Kamptonema sp. SIO1D9]|nr:sodium:proton antiporter [Kamptonema sp. SIO1D9]
MSYILTLLVIGLVLLFVTLGSGWIARIPLSYAIIYLIVGIFLGPQGISIIDLRPGAQFIERMTEIVVIVSVFSCGLKMNRPLKLAYWQTTIRSIGFLMPISIIAIAAVAHWFLGIGWGSSVLLGAILAPTDPVLASEVQLAHIQDRDELRFGLTSEGGLNDALAFPFVYFGLFWFKDSNFDNWFQQWVLIDFIWAIAAGVVMGILVAKAVIWIGDRLQNFRSVDNLMEDFVGLSTILLTYSLTEIVNGYGFLAVFIAGVVVQRRYFDSQKQLSQLEFTEQIEKLLEVATILLLGGLLLIDPLLNFAFAGLTLAIFLFFIIRPVGAWLSTLGSHLPIPTRLLFGWFGIRGVGSIYYLTYSLSKGLSGDPGEQIAWITYIVILCSILVHGITATPLMNWYECQFKNNCPQVTEK